MLLVVSVLASLAAVTFQARRAERERDKAQEALRFMTRLFDLADPSTRDSSPPTLREVLDAGARRIERGLRRQPEVQLELMARMARAYTQIGQTEKALNLVDQALELSRSTFGPGNPAEAPLLDEGGWARFVAADFGRAEHDFRQSLEIQVEALGGSHPNLAGALHGLGAVLIERGAYEEAEANLRRALDLQGQRQPPDPITEAEILEELARLLGTHGRWDEAAAMYRQAIDLREPVLGTKDFTVAHAYAGLGSMLVNTAPEEAERLLGTSRAPAGEASPRPSR